MKPKPQMQGRIDGLCALYTVLNACKLLFDHSERMDQRLLKALCKGAADLFPAIIYDGVEVDGLLRLLEAAQGWTKRVHRCDLICSRPLHRRKMETVGEYFTWLQSELTPGGETRRAAIIGLGKPWEHWTVVSRVENRRAHYFDSWGFPNSYGSSTGRNWTGFSYFTLDKEKAGEEKGQKALLEYHQTFILEAPKR